jgi:hypothetical protein
MPGVTSRFWLRSRPNNEVRMGGIRRIVYGFDGQLDFMVNCRDGSGKRERSFRGQRRSHKIRRVSV